MVNIDILKKYVQLATEFVNVCLDIKSLKLTDELRDFLQENNISLVWDGISADTESLTQGSLALTHVNADDLDMQGLRKVVEVSLSASTENCISVLCLDGNPPSVEKIRNADTILNLL